MNWKKTKGPDTDEKFTVRLCGYLAERSDGVGITYGREGIIIVLNDGSEVTATWDSIFDDYEKGVCNQMFPYTIECEACDAVEVIDCGMVWCKVEFPGCGLKHRLLSNWQSGSSDIE